MKTYVKVFEKLAPNEIQNKINRFLVKTREYDCYSTSFKSFTHVVNHDGLHTIVVIMDVNDNFEEYPIS